MLYFVPIAIFQCPGLFQQASISAVFCSNILFSMPTFLLDSRFWVSMIVYFNAKQYEDWLNLEFPRLGQGSKWTNLDFSFNFLPSHRLVEAYIKKNSRPPLNIIKYSKYRYQKSCLDQTNKCRCIRIIFQEQIRQKLKSQYSLCF